MLGIEDGVERNQCIPLHKGASFGPPGLDMDGAQALGLELRKEMFFTAQAIQERLGDPPARVGVAQLEILNHAHDAIKAHHDTELYSLLPLANRFLWNRRSVSLKIDSLYRVRLLVYEGPSDGQTPTTTGFDVLFKEHGMALFPEDTGITRLGSRAGRACHIHVQTPYGVAYEHA